MPQFSRAITDFWHALLSTGELLHRDARFEVRINPCMPEQSQIMLLAGTDGRARAALTARMAERAGTMLGMGRTVGAKGLGDYELTLIKEEDGRLLFEAHPSGQPVATFTARVATQDSVLFELPEHDFPQRVGYRRIGSDSVLAWVEGTMNGKQRRIEFPYARVPCPVAR